MAWWDRLYLAIANWWCRRRGHRPIFRFEIGPRVTIACGRCGDITEEH